MLQIGRIDKFQIAIVASLLVAAGGYGFWLTKSNASLAAVTELKTTLAERGWALDFADAEVSGAPSRVDIALAQPSLARNAAFAETVWRLSAPTLRTKSLIYRKDYLALTLPAGLTAETPAGLAKIIEGAVAASLIFEDRALTRLSISGPDLRIETRADAADAPRVVEARLMELHWRPDTEGDAETRHVFLRADGLRREDQPAAQILELRLDGALRFATAPGRDAPAPDILSLDLGDAAAPGLSIQFSDGALSLSGRLERTDDGLAGLLHFETDAAPAVIAQLEAFGVIDGAERAALSARVAESGRLAGVLALGPRGVAVRDIQPTDIPIALP